MLSGLRDASREVLDRGVWRPSDESLHIIVRVFSEHPSLLEPAEAKSWAPVSEAQREQLQRAIIEHLYAHRYTGPYARKLQLVVHGYALTSDGSMLLLFEEPPDATASSQRSNPASVASFVALRDELGQVGRSVLGELNSRPKALVHVSAMRLLDWPSNLDAAEAAHVRTTIQAWSSALAANRLPSGEAVPNLGATVRITSLELARDVHWMMTHRQTYANFTLRRHVRTGGCTRDEVKPWLKKMCWTGRAYVDD